MSSSYSAPRSGVASVIVQSDHPGFVDQIAAKTDVLICGAGPTGMVLALRLARAGVRVRIVDAAPKPGTTSRALVVHARTLELYQQMGIAQAFLKEATRFDAVNLWVRYRQVARVALGVFGQGISPFPFATVCPQDRHETFLVGELERAGVRIERSTKLIEFEQFPDRVMARLQTIDGRKTTCEAAFLAGCDGAHSRVREILDTGFPGGTYSHVFYVADVSGDGPVMNQELHVALDDEDFLGVFPLGDGTVARLIGIVKTETEQAREKLTWQDVGKRAIERIGINVSRVNWFSTYRVHHRVASRFQVGRVFLLGDAAHIHSPVGGQGMNTGIGDAVNLSWKLAEVVQGRAPLSIVDSYEPERIAFARRLVATADRAFVFATSSGRLARFVRTRIVPHLLPILVRSNAFRRLLFRTVSQTSINYRGSPLSSGRLGTVEGGDRLPWFEDNYDRLDGIHWQAHVYGNASPWVREACKSFGVALQVFPWKPTMQGAGLTRNGFYLIRPDGHLGLVADSTRANDLVHYFGQVLERAPATR